MEKATEFVHAVGELVKLIPKTILISILGLLSIMTYWFCSIFLIASHFYSTNNISIIIVFSFILSMNWYIVNLALTGIQVAFLDNVLDDEENGTDLDALFASSAIVSVLYLSAMLFISHYCKLSFFHFLLLTYGYILLGFIRIVTFHFFFPKNKS